MWPFVVSRARLETLIFRVGSLGILLALLAPSLAVAARQESAEKAPCPVTLPAPNDKHYGNAVLATALRSDGRIVFEPGGPGAVLADGSLAIKSAWWRLRPGRLKISGKRLDDTAPPMYGDVSEGYPNGGFQPAALIFPTPGCWEVTGHLGDGRLTFVTLVEKIADGPCGKELMDPNEIGGSFKTKVWKEERIGTTGQVTVDYLTGERSYTGGIDGTSTFEYFIMRRPQYPGLFLGYEQVHGVIKGNAGDFAIRHSGTIQADIARSDWTVVTLPSGGAFSKLQGKGTYVTGRGGKACYSLWYSGL
jgi:hypothetical protein